MRICLVGSLRCRRNEWKVKITRPVADTHRLEHQLSGRSGFENLELFPQVEHGCPISFL